MPLQHALSLKLQSVRAFVFLSWQCVALRKVRGAGVVEPAAEPP